jgi:hypothetical protein
VPGGRLAAEPNTLLATITRLATAPKVRVDLLTLLLDRQERAEAKEAERQYYAAMNAAQAEIQPVVRDAENTQTNSLYARLETVDAAIRPIYVKHGFSLSYNQVAPITPGNVRIACKCAHIGGYFEMHYREAPPDTLGPKGTPTKTALHGLGSADTFLKRYINCGIFNVVLCGMDNDGNSTQSISDEQLKHLSQLIHQTKSNVTAFLRHVAPGTERLVDIRASDFAKCVAALETKRRRMQATEHETPSDKSLGSPRKAV